ncbi:MAG: hypothetical protein ACLQNV_19040, partial [Steroidobacteraceae bacterium]
QESPLPGIGPLSSTNAAYSYGRHPDQIDMRFADWGSQNQKFPPGTPPLALSAAFQVLAVVLMRPR